MNLKLISLIILMFLKFTENICATEISSSVTTHFDEEYSINFMWLNSKPQPDQPYICPGTNSEVKAKLLDGAIAWSTVNPRAAINIWFGRMNTSTDAAQNTMDLIKRTPGTELIRLRDICELALVAENPRVFSSELPVYFRVDLARAILLHDLVKNDESTYAVYGDLDMQPMSEAALFDEETVGNLKTIGLVMAHSRSLEFENGFQMISNYNVNILAALKFTVIDLNIERAKIALGQSYFSCDEIHYCHSLKKGLCNDYFKQKTPMCGLWQIVFESYKNVIYYFYALEYLTKIRINVKHSIRYEIKKLPEFDAKDVMHQHLGLYYNINLPILYPERSELAKLELEGLGIPTKRVSLPVSAIMYYSDAFNDGV